MGSQDAGSGRVKLKRGLCWVRQKGVILTVWGAGIYSCCTK
jgi:hypothetical protein